MIKFGQMEIANERDFSLSMQIKHQKQHQNATYLHMYMNV